MNRHSFIILAVVFTCICESALSFGSDQTSEYHPVNLGPSVNSQYDDILPVITPDGRKLYFCRSASPENVGGGRQDIWYSTLLPDGTWSTARNIGAPLNNDGNNYLTSITPDGNTALVGDAYSDHRNQQRSVALTHQIASGWSTPVPIQIRNYYNNNRYCEFTLSNDGRIIIMAIERNDTRGGKDLYVSFRESDSTWSEPLHMGDVLNTPGNEATPFIASDGVSLYFSSEGHGGYGSFDVFVTRRLDSTWTNWSKPENLGENINTSGWDLYYTIPAAGDYAYFVSYSNTYGAGDIFRVKLPEVVRPKPVVLVRGRVFNKKTMEPITARIDYEILPSGQSIGDANSSPGSGDYQIVLPSGKRYGFRASAPGFLSINDNLDVTDLDKYAEIERDLFLVPIEEGQAIVINNIFFDYDKSTLRPESFPELKRIIDVLHKNPSLAVEFGGHTDSVASVVYNIKLSNARAQAVASYVEEHGSIPSSRIVAKGYGKARPVATNSTDEGRQLNRRVEMTILRR